MRKRIPYLKKPKKGAFFKRYVKFLAVCKDPTTSKAALRAAPDQVVKHICNAAVNAYQGDIKLSKKQKSTLKNYKNSIAALSSKNIPLKNKRKIINQKGGFSFVPIILSTVLSALGSSLLSPQRQ